MSAVAAVALLLGAQAVVVVAVALVRRALRRPEVVERGPVTDWCEVCNAPLAADEVCELREEANDDSDLGIATGGTAMVATYCAEHFPVRP